MQVLTYLIIITALCVENFYHEVNMYATLWSPPAHWSYIVQTQVIGRWNGWDRDAIHPVTIHWTIKLKQCYWLVLQLLSHFNYFPFPTLRGKCICQNYWEVCKSFILTLEQKQRGYYHLNVLIYCQYYMIVSVIIVWLFYYERWHNNIWATLRWYGIRVSL